jgi:hypothetical protein
MDHKTLVSKQFYISAQNVSLHCASSDFHDCLCETHFGLEDYRNILKISRFNSSSDTMPYCGIQKNLRQD